MANVFITNSDYTIIARNQNGRIVSSGPITVKNQIRELRSIEDFEDVNTTEKQDGATFIYNSTTGKYDVKLYNDDPFLNVQNLYVTTLWANNSRGINGQVLLTNGNTAFWANSADITVNNAIFAYGKPEEDLSVNFALLSGTANFAITANSASASNTANFASVANNSTFAYGKREENLSVNFAAFSGTSNFAITANSATFVGGKGEGSLNVNSATYATFALNAGLANSGVTPGTYGSTIEIPIITVDQYGIINAVSITAVTGITDFNYNSSNNTFAIHTGANSVFRAAINSVRDFTVTGNLVVSGTTTTVNTEILTVKDPVITLNDGQLTPFNDIGFVMQRYAVANSTNYNVSIAWNESDRKLKFGRVPEDGSDSQITFAQEWLTVSENGSAYFLANTEAGNSVIAGSSMVINSVSFTERNYPGEANTALFFNGTIDCGEY